MASFGMTGRYVAGRVGFVVVACVIAVGLVSGAGAGVRNASADRATSAELTMTGSIIPTMTLELPGGMNAAVAGPLDASTPITLDNAGMRVRSNVPWTGVQQTSLADMPSATMIQARAGGPSMRSVATFSTANGSTPLRWSGTNDSTTSGTMVVTYSVTNG